MELPAGKAAVTHAGVDLARCRRHCRTLAWRVYESDKNLLPHTECRGVLASEQIGGQPSSTRVFAARGPSLSSGSIPVDSKALNRSAHVGDGWGTARSRTNDA